MGYREYCYIIIIVVFRGILTTWNSSSDGKLGKDIIDDTLSLNGFLQALLYFGQITLNHDLSSLKQAAYDL